MKFNAFIITFLIIVVGAAGWRVYEILKPSGLTETMRNSARASGPDDGLPARRAIQLGEESTADQNGDIFRIVTAKVEVEDVTEYLTLRGVILPEVEASIGSTIAGKLQRILKLEGNEARSGEVVAELDPSLLQLEKLKAQAAVARAKVCSENEKRSLDRKKSLLKKNVVSEKDILDEEVEYANAAADLEKSQADLEVIESKLRYCKIVAPFDGFLSRRFRNEGDYIQPEDAIFAIIKIDTVFAACDVLETDYRKIRPNQNAIVEVLAYPTEKFSGAVRRISPNVDNRTSMGKIWIEIDNPNYRLRPGMFATARLQTAVRQNSVVVLRRAVIEKQGKDIVFVKKNGKYHPVEVETGLPIARNRLEIVEGLKPDDEIVVEGNYELAYSDIEDLIVLED